VPEAASIAAAPFTAPSDRPVPGFSVTVRSEARVSGALTAWLPDSTAISAADDPLSSVSPMPPRV